MTFLINEVTSCHHVHKQKMSHYDKNASSQQQESESAQYVKVKLIAGPLRRIALTIKALVKNANFDITR